MSLFEDHNPGGDNAGTIVCLPGVNSGAYLMEGIISAMPGWRILRLNPPGVSGMPLPLPFSVKAYARQVVETLNNAGVGSFVLLGHSLGGYSAQEVARMLPERVSRLILVSTSRGQPDTAMDIAAMQRKIGMSFWEFQQTIAKNPIEGHKPLFGQGYPAREPEMYATFLKLRKAHLPVQSVTLAHISAGGLFSSMGWVRRLKMPTMVIHGTADCLVSIESGRKLAQAMPQAQLLELYEVGHFPMLEYASFWEKVRRFAEEASGGFRTDSTESLMRQWLRKLWMRG